MTTVERNNDGRISGSRKTAGGQQQHRSASAQHHGLIDAAMRSRDCPPAAGESFGDGEKEAVDGPGCVQGW